MCVCVWSLCLVQIAIVVVFIGHNHHDHIIIIIMTMMIMMIKSTIGHKWQSYMKLWPQWWFSDSVIIIIAVFFVMGGDDDDDDDDQWSLLYNTSSIDIIYNIIIDFFRSISIDCSFVFFLSNQSIHDDYIYTPYIVLFQISIVIIKVNIFLFCLVASSFHSFIHSMKKIHKNKTKLNFIITMLNVQTDKIFISFVHSLRIWKKTKKIVMDKNDGHWKTKLLSRSNWCIGLAKPMLLLLLLLLLLVVGS